MFVQRLLRVPEARNPHVNAAQRCAPLGTVLSDVVRVPAISPCAAQGERDNQFRNA
jgi:hypothetical protein